MPKKPAINKEIETMNAFQNDDNSGSLMDDFNSPINDMASDEIIDMSFDDVFDEIVHPTGYEAKLQCVDCTKGTDKNGATYWRLTYEDVNEPKARQIRVFLGFPKTDIHTVRQINNKKKAFMTWKAAHGIPLNQPISPNDCIGLEAWAILRQTEDETYGAQNEVKSWIGSNA